MVNRVLDPVKKDGLLKDLPRMKKLEITEDVARDCENIATGVFSPLEGFLGHEDYQGVLKEMRLGDDTPWTIPIILDLDSAAAKEAEREGTLILTYGERPVAAMDVEETYPLDKKLHAKAIYGTDDPRHPGVAKTYARKDTALGGSISLIDPIESSFPRYHLIPLETRVLFREKGWRTVVGFQTRNVPHLGHEYLQKTALSFTDGLLINPVIGKKKPGDFKDEVIIRTYESLIKNYYLRERAVLVTLQFEMRYAGPREAILHAIVRKNFGCSHFIVGRDHAGVGNYYPPYAAQEIFDDFPDLGIVPLFFRSFFYCRRCRGVANDKTCPHPESDHIGFSGTKIRELLVRGERPPPEIMRPEIADIILGWDSPFVQ